MSLVRRYQEDPSPPTRAQARQDFLRRTLAPAGGLWVVNVGTGWVIVGPLESLPVEVEVNEDLVADRTPLLNTVTQVWSNIGGTHFLILACLAVIAFLWWRTKQWWLAIVPGIALAVQSLIFTTSSFVVGRGRPEVEHLDISPPTSGFPSGHTGASTAFYLVLALLAQRIRNTALRWAVTVLCIVIPLGVGYSRLYRGMHHVSDVTMGLFNGTVCALLAWLYLRRRSARDPDGEGLEPDHDVAAEADPPPLQARS